MKTFKQLLEAFKAQWAPTKDPNQIHFTSDNDFIKSYNPHEVTGTGSESIHSLMHGLNYHQVTPVGYFKKKKDLPGATLFGKGMDKINSEHDTLSAHYKEAQKEHASTIAPYSGNDSKYINNHIGRALIPVPYSKTKPNVDFNDASHDQKAQLMDHAVHHTTTPHDMVVYSGVGDDSSRRHKMVKDATNHPDKLFTSKSFISTSINPKKTFRFTGYNNPRVMAVHVPKGHPGIYIGDHSYSPSEKEFVIPRNSLFQHIKTEKIAGKHVDMDSGVSSKDDVIVHHVRLIHPDDYSKHGHNPYEN